MGAESEPEVARPPRWRCAFESESEEATEAFAEALGARLGAGSVVALIGELGSGKTCFVRGLARGLGVGDEVSSPTYTLMHEYRGRLTLHHYDAWMAGRERAFLEGGGATWLGDEGVAVVEWADRVEAWLPPERLEVRLSHLGPAGRRLELAWLGEGPGGPLDGPGDLPALGRVPGIRPLP